jgi:hypothetical protein
MPEHLFKDDAFLINIFNAVSSPTLVVNGNWKPSSYLFTLQENSNEHKSMAAN